MNRLLIFACGGAGLFFAGLAWVLAAASRGTPATMSAEALGRSAGVALLGFALIATGAVFRSAIRVRRKPAATTKSGPQWREYRRGFGERAVRTRAQPRPGDTVRTLRRAVIEHEQRAVSVTADTTLTMAEIERLHDMLHRRAAQTTVRNNRRNIHKHDLESR
jgi:hypothetical protein